MPRNYNDYSECTNHKLRLYHSCVPSPYKEHAYHQAGEEGNKSKNK